jgi:hypothetical protein
MIIMENNLNYINTADNLNYTNTAEDKANAAETKYVHEILGHVNNTDYRIVKYTIKEEKSIKRDRIDVDREFLENFAGLTIKQPPPEVKPGIKIITITMIEK